MDSRNSVSGIACVTLLAALVLAAGKVEPACGSLAPGAGSFFWDDNTGASDPDKPLDVYYWRPTDVTRDTPVWVIMHGSSRNADDYRDYFIDAAAAQGALILAPEFNDSDWSGSSSYNLGNLSWFESGFWSYPEQDWSFSKIEPLFDYLVDVLEPTIEASTYSMFGHSAGSQFVHRFLFWKPTARVDVAVAANAGWYTMMQLRRRRISV